MKFLAVCAVLALVSPLPNALAQGSDSAIAPHVVIEQTSAELLEAIDGRRESLEANSAELDEIVGRVLRARFDTAYAARLILPRHWDKLTREQRESFVEALYGSLVRRYAHGLLKHSETRVRVTPFRLNLPKPGAEDFITVKTLVVLDNDTEVPVHYAMRLVKSAWMVYDVKIEGRSYVLHYRDILGKEIEDKGLDQVIEDLRST